MLVTFASLPAKPNQPNEDFVAATSDAVVLLDGAGTPRGSGSGCIHGVSWFARRLGATLLYETEREGSLSLVDCLSTSIREVRSFHDDTCDLKHPGTPSATVVALKVREQTVDYLVLADSVLALDLSTELRIISDDHEARIGEQFRARMDALPGGTPEHEEAHREYGSVRRSELRAACVLSDGASRLVDRFGRASWEDVLKTLDTRGPCELLRRVREAEASDLDGSRWPRGKIHDDATAAYCSMLG